MIIISKIEDNKPIFIIDNIALMLKFQQLSPSHAVSGKILSLGKDQIELRTFSVIH